MSTKIVTDDESVNLLFFENGSYRLQKSKNGEEISSKSLTLSEPDLKSLEKLITKAKPMVWSVMPRAILSINSKPSSSKKARVAIRETPSESEPNR